MKSTSRRRVTSVERALLEWLDSERPRSGQPISDRSFSIRVEQRQRITGETYEQAAQALVVHLRDDELDTLISELQAIIANDETDTRATTSSQKIGKMTEPSSMARRAAPNSSVTKPRFYGVTNRTHRL